MTRRCLGLVLTLAVVVLAGCAGIPTSGPVERVEDEVGLGESTVRYTPSGPIAGMTETQIVRGFLDAMLAYPVTHRVAAEYRSAASPSAAARAESASVALDPAWSTTRWPTVGSPSASRQLTVTARASSGPCISSPATRATPV